MKVSGFKGTVHSNRKKRKECVVFGIMTFDLGFDGIEKVLVFDILKG